MVPPPKDATTRRALLAAVAGAAAGLTGCPAGRPEATASERGTHTTTERGDRASADRDGPTTDPNGDQAATGSDRRTAAESEQGCTAGDRQVGDVSVSVDGAWSQFQADPGNTGYSSDATGPTDPSLAWRYATCDRPAEAPPVVADDSVYVGGGSLRAFDAATGEVEWRVAAASPTAPVVDEDTVYFAGRDLLAVDRTDGTVLWRNDRESDILAHASPTLAGGTLYVPGAVDDPTLRAFDTATGRQRWQLTLDGEFGPGPPAVAGDRVFVTDDADRLLSVGTDGSDVRVLAGGPDDTGIFSPPAAADGTVYVGGLAGRVRAFDAASGQQQWTNHIGEGGVPGPPVVGDGRLYVVDAGAVHALTTDGDRFWKRPSADFGLPVLAGDTLYVGGYAGSGADSGDPAGLLAALDAADGTERWSYTTRGYWDDSGNPDIHAATTAPVAVADGAVFALTGAGDLLALG